MGKFIWHQWARFVAITASVYSVWAAFWGIFYRKFFWDFVDGTVRSPGGVQPGPGSQPFVAIIVKVPIIQIATLSIGIILLCMELPLPLIKNTSLHRTWLPRMILLITQAFLAALFYQGTNGSIWSLIALFGYTNALFRGEKMEVAKENRGKDGAA